MSTKLLIGTLMFFIVAQVLCNIVDGSAMYANTSAINDNMTQSSLTQSSDSSGTPATYVSMGQGFFSMFNKVVFWDFTIFRNTDGTPNDFVIIRYLLICIGIALLIELAVTMRQIIAG